MTCWKNFRLQSSNNRSTYSLKRRNFLDSKIVYLSTIPFPSPSKPIECIFSSSRPLGAVSRAIELHTHRKWRGYTVSTAKSGSEVSISYFLFLSRGVLLSASLPDEQIASYPTADTNSNRQVSGEVKGDGRFRFEVLEQNFSCGLLDALWEKIEATLPCPDSEK